MSESVPLRRVQLDLPQASMARLEKLKAITDASSYGEVVRAALREYEERLAEQAAKVTA